MAQRGVGSGEVEALAWSVLAMGSSGLLGLLWLGWRAAHKAWVLLLTVIWVLYGLLGYPLLNDSSSARGVMTRAGQLVGPDAELALVGWKEQNMLMADRPVRDFGFKRDWLLQLDDALQWQQQKPGQRWLLVQQPLLLSCIDRDRAVPVGTANRRGWWLVPAAAVRQQPCPVTAADQQQVRQAQGPADDES